MKIQERVCTENNMELQFDAVSQNEAFARVAVAAFTSSLNPTMEEISDIKTAVSEAVTNAIIHGYEGDGNGKVFVSCQIREDVLSVEVRDKGKGIEDVERAMEPMFTTKPEQERSGMGFSFMEAFMDDLEVYSIPLAGTTVKMKKKIGTVPWLRDEE